MITSSTDLDSSAFFSNSFQPSKLNRMSLWHKPWFYKHVETFLFGENHKHLTEKAVEYIPTKDFYHRHNKGWFWLMEHTISFANHPIFRLVFCL